MTACCATGQTSPTESTAATARQWGTAAFKTPYQADLSDAEKIAGLSELWAEAKFGFANFWHVPSLDWDGTYRDYLPRVLATKSTGEYYRVLARFYALLQDGHTDVNAPEELLGGRLALTTALVDGKVLVTGSRDSKFDMQGLRPGDEIVSIDGTPAKAWAETNVAPYISASTPQDRDSRVFYRQLLTGPIGTEFRLRVRASSGMEAEHAFRVTEWSTKRPPLFTYKVLPGGFAYVALNGFDDSTPARDWDRHWSKIKCARGIILDLRENGGGNDSVNLHILATLLTGRTSTTHGESTRWIASDQAWGKPQTPERFGDDFLEPDRTRHYSGPVVMLTGEKTFSAGEDMAAVFRIAHRGRILGEPTGGSTGQPLSFDLPGGGSARVCSKHDSFPDGTEFVGVGILPDRVVHLTRDDIRTGHDPVLEAAVQELAGR